MRTQTFYGGNSTEIDNASDITTPYSLPQIFYALSDPKSTIICKTLAFFPRGLRINEVLRHSNRTSDLQIPTRQLYRRIAALTKCGLVTEKESRYTVTLLGKVVYYCMTLIERAIHIHSKLHTIDLIEASDIDSEIPAEKTNEIINILIADEQIKNIVLSYRKIISTPESVEHEQEL